MGQSAGQMGALRRWIFVVLLGLLVGACSAAPASSAPVGARSAQPLGSVANDVATPSFEAIATPSPTPATSQESSPTTGPTAPPLTEASLLGRLRSDARVACSQNAVLPPAATTGLECHPSTKLVGIVRLDAFLSQADALQAYRDELAARGVKLRSGSCTSGKPGDESWTPGDGADGIDSLDRDGCYFDGHGLAVVDVLCGVDPGVSIEIFGKTSDLAALEHWAWAFPKGAEVSTPSAPGICYGPGV